MSRFFIDRPIFAWVLAVIVMLVGAISVRSLPIAQYPAIAPPAVSITANYPGASAETLQTSVTQVIEQQLKGIDNLLYFSSNSSSNGQVVITVTFNAGTNPDIAQVQVQNKVQQATPLLPAEVQQQGLVVAKSQNTFLLVVAVYDETDKRNANDMSDYIISNLQDPLSRVSGVGDMQIFGGQYAMRIWLDPYKLNTYQLMPSDVRAAILAQNVQVSAGQIGGAPAVPGQAINATINAQSRLQTPEQFRAILLKSNPDGSHVKLSDVARVELGAESYAITSRLNGHAAAGMAVKLAPGANALKTAAAVKAAATAIAVDAPPGVKLSFPVDNTTFVNLSIHQVIETLIIAVILVVIVMFVFLQSWRATLIPTIALPVVLLGTCGVLAVFGYSINTLTLFAMVLAIGLLVDDAIVVVENVERLMTDEGLSPVEATRKSMEEITGALVGIGLVLSAVFLPMAFFGGSTGVIYRQFSITIISAMALSVAVALVLTPALCATLLKAPKAGRAGKQRGFFGWFNRSFDKTVTRYDRGLGKLVGRPLPALIVYGVIVAAMALLFVRMPTGFLPDEDQGSMFSLVTLPSGAPESRTGDVMKQLEHHFMVDEKANVAEVFTATGFNFAGNGQNLGQAFIRLRDWEHRKGAANRAPAIAGRAMGAVSRIRDAAVFVLVAPPVQELGNATGFDLQLKDVGGIGHERLLAARNQLLGMASQTPSLVAVRPNGQEDTPQLNLHVDPERAGALGVSQSDVNATLSAAWGGAYVNDFVDRGRVKRVFIQGDAPFRMSPEDLQRWFVRGASGVMAPFSAFATTDWSVGPARLERYNGQPSLNIQGQAAPGNSSGAAMTTMEQLVGKLPKGVGYEWTGQSFQERAAGSQAPALYALSILVVFLCLAALYESWSIPVAVVMVIPMGVLGALAAATLRGYYNDIYFQVGLLTIIGLSAKNAILIVEFAIDAERRGETPVQAAMLAARQRLRPILMTSIAFICGVIPLAISTGAGAGSQNDIGTGVIGGMLSATLFAIFLIPVFYVGVRTFFPGKSLVAKPEAEAPEPTGPSAPSAESAR